MTESIKITDMHMQQRNIEYERQRHLANWLIESSPHMPKPTAQQFLQQQNKKQKKLFTTSIFHDSFFFLSKLGPQSTPSTANQQLHQETAQSPTQPSVTVLTPASPTAQQPPQQIITNNIALTKSSQQAFTSSQTNLPLQIVQSSRDGNKPKLRRFNSHDTSANMFSVADFENARLARRNELELVRQKTRYKMNSLSSGCDSSTGDSKGSKLSSESNPEPMSAESFLDRYSLPRIARLIAPNSFYELQQQHKQGQSNSLINKAKKPTNNYLMHPSNSAHQATNSGSYHSTNCSDDLKADNINNGELFLLYRHLKNYKVYHGVNAKSGTNRKKGIKIPQDFPGYFSMANEKGSPTATLYTTMIQLVRERVYKFLSVDNMQAYTESSSSTDNNNTSKSHYVKITAKAGQVFRLLAVFEDGGQDSKTYTTPKKEGINSIGREKEKGRYVQLLSETRQIIYVSLSTKGKFYEIEQTNPQLFAKNGSNGRKPKELNSDCVHRISCIITDETVFPINLKFISKQTNGLTNNASIPDNIKITRVSIENSVIACPIDETEFCNPLHLVKLYLVPDMKFLKCILGFENEKIMFSNPNVQNLLKFCQFNCDNFVRAIDYENLPKESITKSTDNLNSIGIVKQKTKTTSAFSKFFGSDKHSSAHEKEDSIIFLSKNELENMENQKQMNTNHEQDKMKAFQSNGKKGWFKNLRTSSSNSTSIQNLNSNTNGSNSNKTNSFVNLSSNSMDRYQDMSKLIQERFGTIEINDDPDHQPQTSTTIKSSSEISYDLNDRSNKAMQKCFSLQNIELNNSMDIVIQQPDLVVKQKKDNRNATDDDKIERDMTYSSQIHSSNDSALNSLGGESKSPRQQSFITEKLFNEFYVKTKQYSKSSSSLHQLLHFSVPQKMNIRETKRKQQQNEEHARKIQEEQEEMKITSALLQLQLPPPPPIEEISSGSEVNDTMNEVPDDDSIMTDDLPYCSVRDSIVTHHDEHLNLKTPTENIYAEICAGTPPIPSDASEVSYQLDKPTQIRTSAIITNTNKQMKNVSSIRISFGSDRNDIQNGPYIHTYNN